MATCTITKLSAEPEVLLATWTLTTADPTGDAISFPQFADKSWQFTGTWGGATAAAQSANTNTTSLFAATDNANGGAAITATADSKVMAQIPNGLYDRPKLTTTGTNASVTATLVMRKNPRY